MIIDIKDGNLQLDQAEIEIVSAPDDDPEN